MKNSNIDLSNADGLDESIWFNFTNESLLDGLTENTSLLNANGDSNQYVSPEMIQAGVATTGAIVSGIQAKKASPAGQTKQELKAVCGRKPLVGKKRKKAYNECVSNYVKSKQAPSPDFSSDRTVSAPSSAPSSSGSDKIMGMPKPLAIGLGIVAAAGLIFVGMKMFKAKAA